MGKRWRGFKHRIRTAIRLKRINAAVAEITKPEEDQSMDRKGTQTSEFKAGVVVTGLVSLAAMGNEAGWWSVEISPETAASIVAGFWAVYTVARSWLKGR